MCIFTLYRLLDFLVKFITPLISLILAIVAFRLSRKVTFKQKVKEEQFKLVTELIKNMSNKEIFFMTQEKGPPNTHSTGSLFYFQTFLATNFKEKFGYLYEGEFLIEATAQEQFTSFLTPALNTGINLMPDKIRDLLKKFQFRGDEQEVQENSIEKWCKLVNFVKEGKKEPVRSVKSQVFPTFQSFYDFMQELFDAINEWLKKHDAGEIGFKRDFEIK